MEVLRLRVYKPTAQDRESALEISDWISQHKGQMITRPPEELLSFFANGRSLLVQMQLENGGWANAMHAALTVIKDGKAELGAVVTPKYLNGSRRCIAAFGIENLMNSEMPEGLEVYAFALRNNTGSTKLFRELSIADEFEINTAPDIFFEESIVEGESKEDYHGFRLRRGRQVHAEITLQTTNSI